MSRRSRDPGRFTDSEIAGLLTALRILARSAPTAPPVVDLDLMQVELQAVIANERHPLSSPAERQPA